MYFDGVTLAEGSVVKNLTVASGSAFPVDASVGELFYLSSGAAVGLHIFDGTIWNRAAPEADIAAMQEAAFIVKSANSAVPNSQALDSLGAGFVKTSGSSGVLSSTPAIDLGSSDVSGILAASRFPAVSGEVIGSNGSTALALSATGVTPGTYNKITVDSKGRVTSAINTASLAVLGITDAVASNPAITAGTGSKVTVDAKGLVTGYTDLAPSDIPSLSWLKITSDTPTTVSGYGITDAYTKTETDSRIQAIVGAAPQALDTLAELAAQLAADESAASALTLSVATKLNSDEVESTAIANKVLRLDSAAKLPASITGNAETATSVEWSGVASTPTTVSGYGITDAYTKAEVDSAISSVTSGNVATASAADKLTTARNIAISGDASGTVSFDGSADVSIAATLADSGVAAGSYTKVDVNAKGIVTAGTTLLAADIPSLDWAKITSGKPSTLAGYGIGDAYTKAEVDNSLTAKVETASLGAANGVATLGSDSKVPAIQLPSYVDDVLEFAVTEDFPATGESGKIYVTTGTAKTYRWSGSIYIEIAAAPGSTDAVVEGMTNLYFTDARAQAAAAQIVIDGGSF
jgi:phage-related tail fiber protein